MTSQSVSPFSFEGQQVRVVEINGEPWFVGKDVAERLGYTNPPDAIKQHCKGVAKRYPLQTAGGKQEVRVLSESDVMRLIVNSHLPSAVEFERWVFDEVLPTIRKTGGYGKPVATIDLSDPVVLVQLLTEHASKRIEAERRASTAEHTVQVLAPKADALDRLSTADGSLCITDAAKTLQVRPKDLFGWMTANGWIYTRAGKSGHLAYQDKIKTGYLEHKVTTVNRSDGSEKVVEAVRVTPKGLAKLALVVPGASSGELNFDAAE